MSKVTVEYVASRRPNWKPMGSQYTMTIMEENSKDIQVNLQKRKCLRSQWYRTHDERNKLQWSGRLYVLFDHWHYHVES